MEHEGNVNIQDNKKKTPFLPQRDKGKASSAFFSDWTCLKCVAGLKMSPLESGEDIMLLLTAQLLCYM